MPREAQARWGAGKTEAPTLSKRRGGTGQCPVQEAAKRCTEMGRPREAQAW